MPRRSYDQYCPVGRALDTVGERWTLLIVRELLAGPRRYTDLHADLPGVSTDVLAARLKELEADGLVTRRRLPAPGSAQVYELTARGRGLLPVLAALAEWGGPLLTGPRPTDAVRAHWYAVPLMRQLPAVPGVLEVHLDEGVFHLTRDAEGPRYADGPAERPDAQLTLDAETGSALARGNTSLPDAVASGRARLRGDGPLVRALGGAA
jgi:DNA-binding HxlR family transcriptional regulator